MVRWPWNRHAADTTVEETDSPGDIPEEVPPEVTDYYQAERRERRGMALLVGAGALVATLLVAAALFFGGRWLYRQIAGTRQRPNISENTRPPARPGSTASPNEADRARPSGQAPSPPTGSTVSPPSGAAGSSEPSPSTPSSGPAGSVPAGSSNPPGGQAPISRTGDSGAPLARTGPAENMSIVGLVTVASALAHRRWLRRRPNPNR